MMMVAGQFRAPVPQWEACLGHSPLRDTLRIVPLGLAVESCATCNWKLSTQPTRLQVVYPLPQKIAITLSPHHPPAHMLFLCFDQAMEAEEAAPMAATAMSLSFVSVSLTHVSTSCSLSPSISRIAC